MVELHTSQPRWRQVYKIISDRIRSGHYKVGERIPSLINLVEEFGIANATGQKVMRALRQAGLIHTEPGLGSYVADPSHWEEPPADDQQAVSPAPR
ncbi:GntR family transcriptional regulator [Microtetraspora malaysiensis]|uniref:GntR family transcriptional regulator n=1 Tax=Microtetraspora malaysiensis TaxID=161358 RepID=A0ABW6SXF5_9ACTN